ncbi:TonB-dependent receptor [Chitinophaga sp. MM2321]|uniref:TonB-dependent receptor n=1 Tax=Chitinophaga sp. MM2321 TaxID=3137178 RepID=UPI0032D57DC3
MELIADYKTPPGVKLYQIKVFLIMKLVTYLMLFACLQAGAKGFAQKVTLNENKTSLDKILKKIGHQTGYTFLYENKVLEKASPVTLKVNDASLEQALNLCFSDQPLMYKIYERTVVIKEKLIQPMFLKEAPFIPLANIVNGKVTSSRGEPLPGVSVIVKGTTTGTATDENGNYSINVPGEGVLVFSYVGFATRNIPVNGQTLVNIMMEESPSALDQVVVVGYGKQKKTSLTAAISTLSGKEISSVPLANISNGFAGRIPGVIVRQSSGEPGRDGSNIYIRGISSIGGTEPLVIVDGIPRSSSKLDPNTIESFTVLKDAAAVAPYGVAGANGVILVTTKRGKTGAPSLTYNGYIGFQNPTNHQKQVTPYQFAQLKNQAAVNDGFPAPYNDYALQKFKDGTEPDVYPVDDVWKELTRKNTLLTNHNIEVSGGNEKVKYYGSLGYLYQAGLWPTTSEDKYNVALNLEAAVTKTTKFLFNINGVVRNDKYPPVGQDRGTARLFELIGYSHPGRGGPLVFSNGMYGKFIMGSIFNKGYAFEKSTNIYTQVSLEQDLNFLPGLKFKGTVAYDPNFNLNKTWLMPVQLATVDTTKQPYVIKDGIYGQTKSSLTENYAQAYQLTFQASLNYSRSFGKNNVMALAVVESKDNNSLSLGAIRRNYNLDIDELSMGSSSQADMSNSGSSAVARQVGVVYRLNYDYNGKYLFEASGRYDGSYYFAPENQFGFFPAFSLGWRLSEENFMKHIGWINNLKLRGSYGEVGALAGSAFQYLSSYAVAGPAYALRGETVQAISERSEPNRNITWERAKKSDVGIEATLWNGILNVEADYFFEKRSNMLVNPDVIVPAEYGIGLSQVNAAVMKNQGIEFSVGTRYEFNKDLQVTLGGNFTYAKNTLLQIFETSATYNNPNRRLTGKPLGTQFGYHSLGFFQEDDFDGAGALKSGIAVQPWGTVHPGDIRYEDINKDGKIDNDDLTRIGDPQVPQLIYGVTTSINYKGFSLDLLFQGTGKRDFYLNNNAAWIFYNGMTAFTNHLDFWTPENPNAKNPRLTSTPTSNNMQASSFYMLNAAYLRLKSATLSYIIPVQKLNIIQSARVYVSGQNLLTWSGDFARVNLDPETSDGLGRGYPQQRVFSLGLNITFK